MISPNCLPAEHCASRLFECYTDNIYNNRRGDQERIVKAVIYYAYDDIRVENRYIPSISDTELLVKVHGCGLCGSEIVKIVQQVPPSVVLGHELTGTIVERGRDVNSFKVGQWVVISNYVLCGKCQYCRTSTYSSSPEELRIALGLLANRTVRVDGLISHRLPLERFPEGVTLMRERKALKVYYKIWGE